MARSNDGIKVDSMPDTEFDACDGGAEEACSVLVQSRRQTVIARILTARAARPTRVAR